MAGEDGEKGCGMKIVRRKYNKTRRALVIDAHIRHILNTLSMLWVLLLSTVPCAEGNDTMARVGAGGLTFLKSEAIRLIREELEISTKSVKVRYKFLNESITDIRTVVAFPMPVYGWNPGESAVDANERPLSSFKVWVDGQRLPTKISRRALIGEADVTEKLRNSGLSEKQIFQTFGDCTIDGCGVGGEQIANISKSANDEAMFPQWKIEETIYWEQTFPKGREILVSHEYSPFVGYSFSSPFQSKWLGYVPVIPVASDKDTISKESEEACVDDNTRKIIIEKVKDRARKGASRVFVVLEDIL